MCADKLQMSFSNATLTASVSGDYNDGLPLANITIAGLRSAPKSVSITIGGQEQDCNGAKSSFQDGVLSITNLESATENGIWSADVTISLSESGSWGGPGGHWGKHHWQAEW